MLILLLALAGLIAYGSYWGYRHRIRSAHRIICFGDSLTTCGGYGGRFSDFLADELPEYEVINQGLGGDTLDRGRERFKSEALDLNPQVVIIELGANDFFLKTRTVEAMRADLEYLVAAATDRGIGVLIAGVFGPRRADQPAPAAQDAPLAARGAAILRMEREVALRYGCVHVENIQAELRRPRHWADPRHPNADGNRLVAQEILPTLRMLLDTVQAARRKSERAKQASNEVDAPSR